MKSKSYVSIATLVVAILLTPVGAHSADQKELKARYQQAESYRLSVGANQDFDQAFTILSSLAEEGYARAQDRLAYYYLRGIGTDIDVEQSAFWYRQAINNGRDASRISLGKLLLKTGQPEDALRQLELAAELDLRGAKAQLAVSHYKNEFGDLSEPEFGRQSLEDLAGSGDESAMRLALILLSKGSDLSIDKDGLLISALTVAEDPENRNQAKIAEALIPFLRSSDARGSRALRMELLQNPKIRDKIRLAESLHLAIENEPGRFWTLSEEIVNTAGPNDFARALFLTSRFNKNAYVRILQKELAKRGYFNGRASGYLNAKTIRAVNRFCKDQGIRDACLVGPLKSKAIKAISVSLAESSLAS